MGVGVTTKAPGAMNRTESDSEFDSDSESKTESEFESGSGGEGSETVTLTQGSANREALKWADVKSVSLYYTPILDADAGCTYRLHLNFPNYVAHEGKLLNNIICIRI